MSPYPLQDGERVLWSGAPTRRRRWLREHHVRLFGALLVVAAVATAIVVDRRNAQYLGLFTILLFGFGIFWSRRLANRRARLDVETYFVTDRRVVFVAQWPTGAEFRWAWLNRLGPAQVKTGADTVIFGTSFAARWRVANQNHEGAWAPFVPELWAIPDAERVAALIRQAQSAPFPKRTGNILETQRGPVR
ncbi:hypothetical protein OG439_14545 [Amycolatopsis sp. NBC_01307]|uniref:hypothetical protein n=1 Tax=Amycolatopsis sp. NBC_01307 TaxID=2903561 RepID=UPI002E0D560C|nr:hypothetical protein OG439_14545 [Amycolatopsis sp. NBC_01307]